MKMFLTSLFVILFAYSVVASADVVKSTTEQAQVKSSHKHLAKQATKKQINGVYCGDSSAA